MVYSRPCVYQRAFATEREELGSDLVKRGKVYSVVAHVEREM